MGKQNYDVSPEAFVLAYCQSSTTAEVAEKLGMPRDIVNSRAAVYRKAGVKLKKLSRPAKQRLDVDALNRTIEKLANSASVTGYQG